MKDNNSIDAAGFFLSQADIDKINSNNDEIGNPDWFTGVTEGESDKEGYDEYIVGTWSFMINDYLKGCLNFESNDLKDVLGREPFK